MLFLVGSQQDLDEWESKKDVGPELSMTANKKMRRSGKRLAIVTVILVPVLYLTGFYSWRQPQPTHATAQAATGYADPATCARCHGEIAKTFRQTGMGQSFHRAGAGDRIEDFKAHNILYNGASDRYYTMTERDGQFYEQRHQLGFRGKETNQEEKQIDYVIGSGNHSRTYLHRTGEGKLVELPVSWYSEMGGYWGMSPGYDRPDQKDFRRPIGFECMSCHNAYPALDLTAKNDDENIFGKDIPEGIDCQRCHGPGGAHVRLASSDGASLQSIQAAIVNPATLSRERQLDVCMQCHLETTSLPLPHSIRRYNRAPFSYRPDESLEDYELFFDHEHGTGYDDRFEVAHQAYRLRKSACFLKSQMTCTTCHNPHEALRGEEATKHYVAVCSSCHANVHPSMRPVTGSNCLTCHMWKRRTEDAVHVVMTDHYIQRIKPKGDLLAPVKETVPLYHDEVVPYFPASLAQVPDGELYLAVAQVEDGSNLEAGALRLRQAIEKNKPDNAQFYFALGTAYAKSGKNKEAIRWYNEALRRRPSFPAALREVAATLASLGDLTRAAETGEKASAMLPPDTVVLTNLGSVYLQQGRTNDARRVLEQALAINPDLPDAKVFLGLASMNERDLAAGESLFRSAISAQPDSAEANNDLASILVARGDYSEAVFHLQKAVEGNPSNVEVHRNYGKSLALTGAFDQAALELKQAMQFDPKSAELHVDLGDVLVKRGDMSQAEQQYRTALTLDSANGKAHLKLADLLVHRGQLQEARQHYQTAAESADPRIRQAALNALHR
jgi:tetratricopeptide (TPR) repeat protein